MQATKTIPKEIFDISYFDNIFPQKTDEEIDSDKIKSFADTLAKKMSDLQNPDFSEMLLIQLLKGF